MNTKTRSRTETREVITEYRVCDVCEKEIPKVKHAYKCKLCERDVCLSGWGLCGQWDDDLDASVCSICQKLGEKYYALKERQEVKLDAEYEKWKEACDSHRYDEPVRKGKRK